MARRLLDFTPGGALNERGNAAWLENAPKVNGAEPWFQSPDVMPSRRIPEGWLRISAAAIIRRGSTLTGNDDQTGTRRTLRLASG